MTDQKYIAILFDLDDTLLDFSGCETKALRKALAKVGVDVSDEEWTKIWQVYQQISSSYWQQKQSSGLSRQQIIEASMQDTFGNIDRDLDSLQLAQIYWYTFCHTACLNPSVKETVESLSNHYQLGIVTNGYTESQVSRLKASGLANYFQSVVVSETVGNRKPAPEIFSIAFKELQVGPPETLFVGDSMTHDYQGAVNAGIDFCYFNPRSQLINAPLPKYSIKKMSQVIDILND